MFYLQSTCFDNALAMWREAMIALLCAVSSMCLLFVAAVSLGAFVASMISAGFVVVCAVLPLLMADWCLQAVAACFWRAMKVSTLKRGPSVIELVVKALPPLVHQRALAQLCSRTLGQEILRQLSSPVYISHRRCVRLKCFP